ncbi:MAG: 50S ribosomal protein L10 [Omnitrophica bacterium]|nr:50S ribosomal protein L10 [Candidatus Omnitrophota bacterium]
MQKIGLLVRERIVKKVKGKVEEAQGFFFIDFNKVGAFAVNTLRNDLKDSGARVFVTKNSLFKRALQESGYQDIESFLEAETGVVFVEDKDVVKACKVLVNFAKENEGLKIKGGIISNKKIGPKDLTVMAKLPSREVLLGMAVSGLAAPLIGFANSLNQIILKFLWVVEEIKNKKVK